jgi:acetyl esterase/lipase
MPSQEKTMATGTTMASPQLQIALAMDATNREAAGISADWLDIASARASLPDLGLDLPAEIEQVPVDAGGVPAVWVGAPSKANGPRVVYLHGGGFVAGGLPSHRSLVAWLAHEVGGSVLFVDYGLAPEHKFPTQIEQAHTALGWAAGHGPAGAGATEALAIAGDSAGAALAMGALLLARERGSVMPRAAALFCGMLDLDPVTSAFAGSSRRMIEMVQAYLPNGTTVADPLASPLRADLAGLPAMLLQTGTADGCRADSQAFTKRLQDAGGHATLTVWPEMFHVWHRFAPLLPEAHQALVEAAAFLRANMGL